MDLLKNFESDQRILNELKDLLQFAPPGELRKSLEHTFFHIFMEEESPCLPNQKQIVSHYYYLINFLNEVERAVKNQQ